MSIMLESHTVQIFGTVLLIAVLLQSACIAVTFFYFRNELSKWQDTLSRHSIACLTGETLGSYIGALKAGKDRSVDLEEDPCGQVRLHLQYLTEKIMTEHYGKQLDAAVKGEVSRILPYLSTEVQTPSLSLPQTRIAAHVTGSQTKEEGNVEKNKKMKMFGQKIETWEKDRGLAFLQNIELKNGELVIPRAGLYYIYSQTYFRYIELKESDDSGKPIYKQMVQYIYKITTYPDPILLMKSAKTTCWSKNAEYGLYSIYQGGVFEMKQNDRIFVSLSNVEVTNMDETSSYFGAFLIS
ncbi:tumor necrosis factor ligand superfamily member 10 isoform X2 [Protopterus annectens]|uniref:tumor necrosis factor ligand superfamily member 10 isoform X2 n=1 Tax=Protopterus annectens TaxID=7888 RepID=UPI001CF941EE|nr:tumor necrosis factor ligand superfamily member 10 isoform X2 [Protopterus annectens]